MTSITLLLPMMLFFSLKEIGNRFLCLFQQLLIFGKISGLSINMDKSSIYFGGVSERLKQIILEDTRLVEGSFPF
jgi:hypothetical protein